MSVTAFLGWLWAASGPLAFTIATLFAFAGEPTDMEFSLARTCMIGAASLGGSYLIYRTYEIDAGWVLKGIVASVIASIVVGLMFASLWYLERRETQLTTHLYPGNVQVALPAGCEKNAPKDALFVMWGSNVSWSNSMPHTIIQMRGEPILQIDRTASDYINVSTLKIFDDRNNIIVSADGKGAFWVRDGVRHKRKDSHTLQVYDHNDDKILDLWYANPSMLVVNGTFRKNGAPTIKLTSESAMIGTNSFRNLCFGSNGTDLAVN